MTRAKKDLFAGLFLALLTFAAYSSSLRGRFIWDDNEYVAHNQLLRDAAGLRRIWTTTQTPQFYPMVFTSFWLERHLWGLHTPGYHAANVLLHIANALLAWIILRRLGLRHAWWAGLLFALHPVHVESVAWISERKNVLSGLFFLLSLGAFFEEALPDAAALAFFALALLSKTAAAPLPLVLAVLSWMKGRKLDGALALRLAPFLLMSLTMGVLTLYVEKYKVGASGPDWDLSFFQRLALAGQVPWFYASKLVWPARLAFFYPRWNLDASSPAQGAPLCAGIFVLALLRARREALAAVLCFLAMLTPVMGFIDFYPMRFSYVADHFQYLASLGLIALLAASLPRWCLAAAALCCAGLTWRHAAAFKDSESLWRDTISKTPTSWIAWSNLSAEEMKAGRFAEAAKDAAEAVRLRPDYPEGQYNLGAALAMTGDPAGAVSHLKTALTLRPDYVWALNHLGILASRAGKVKEAISYFERALLFQPESAYSHYNLAAALASQGRVKEALPHCLESARLEPEDPAAAEVCRRLALKAPAVP